MPSVPDHNQERFEELVLYIAWQTKHDPEFGRTKLAKVLFYSDFTAYAEEGRAFTGVAYEAWEHGPFPPALARAEKALEDGHRATVQRFEPDAERGEYEPFRILPHEPPNKDLFEPWELVVVDQWIYEIASASATKISELSHEHPGWKLARPTGAEIPYESALISTRPPRPEIIGLAKRRFSEPGAANAP